MGDGEVTPGTLGSAYDTVTTLYATHPGTMVEVEVVRMEERPPDSDGVIAWLVVVKASVWLGNNGGSAKTFGVNTNGDDLHAACQEAEEAALDRALELLGIPYVDLGAIAQPVTEAPAIGHASDAMRANPPFGASAPPPIASGDAFQPGTFDANGHPLRPAKAPLQSSGDMDPAALKADITARCKALDIDITGKTPTQVAEMIERMYRAKASKGKDGKPTMVSLRDALLSIKMPDQLAPQDDLPLPEEMTLEEALS